MNSKYPVLTILLITIFLFINLGWSDVSAHTATFKTLGSILYVKHGTSGDCLTWATACDLQTALGFAIAGDQIWVAAGTYKPIASTDRSISFALKSGVSVYGGFPAAGGTWEERDPWTNITTLSGDIETLGQTSDNSYHVVVGSSVDATARLDGFTISNDNANGVATDSPAPAPPQAALTVIPPPPGTIVINFDDVAAPCLFMDTTALRDQYAGLGVLFMGLAVDDGGGVVDQCGSWGVSGHSPPNFIGFNQDAYFSNGGIPRPPETITFTDGATHVQVNTGSSVGAGQIVTMEAFDAAGISLGSDSLTLASTLDTLSITANRIAYVVINSPTYFVLDDLAFLVPHRTYLPLVFTD